MKPVVDMEGGKSNFAVVVQPENVISEGKQKPKKTRILVGVVVGLITLVVVSAVVVLAVHFGVKMTRDSYQEAWKTYQTMNGETVDQKVDIKEDEVDVTVPNALKVVYDYKNELEVTRMIDPDTREYGDCYAKPLNHTEADNTQADGEMTGTQINEYEVEYKATTNRVPDHMISDSVKKLCQGVNVYWLERARSSHVTKREICPLVKYNALYVWFYSTSYVVKYIFYYQCSDGIYYKFVYITYKY